MKRGEIWTVAGGSGYAGKLRPAAIVQDDNFDATDSVTICASTTDPTKAPLLRLPIEPTERNGLRVGCRLMIDKITTVGLRMRAALHVATPDPAGSRNTQQPSSNRAASCTMLAGGVVGPIWDRD